MDTWSSALGKSASTRSFTWSSPPKANKERQEVGLAVRERITLSFCARAGLHLRLIAALPHIGAG
jgi:hypothetical protein